VPVILLTGSAGASAVHEARRVGLKVVYKPVSLSGLKAVVETACGQTA